MTRLSIAEYAQPKAGECKGQQLTTIGNRLLDWFSVIMADSKKRHTRNNEKTKGKGNAPLRPHHILGSAAHVSIICFTLFYFTVVHIGVGPELW